MTRPAGAAAPHPRVPQAGRGGWSSRERRGGATRTGSGTRTPGTAGQQNGTRIVRVTVTLINNTGRPQRAKTWSLTARVGDLPAEMVLWPEEGYREVPDVILGPHRSARFMIAVRIPYQRTQLKINADRCPRPRRLTRPRGRSSGYLAASAEIAGRHRGGKMAAYGEFGLAAVKHDATIRAARH